MYRHLILQSNHLCSVQKSPKWNYYQTIVRTLTGKRGDQSDEVDTPKKNKGGKMKVAKTEKAKELFRLEKATKKLETLVDSAKEFKSISPKDSKSVSKVIGKPKHFVRATARNEKETKHEAFLINDEPITRMSKGIDRRLAEAAWRVAKRMPDKIQSKIIEKELIESLNQQKIETEKAKKNMKKPPLEEDYKQSISYQIMGENQKKSSYFNDEASRVGSTVEKLNLPQPRRIEKGQEGIGTRRPPRSLFTSESLKIFNPKRDYSLGEVNPLWDKLARAEIELAAHCPPENGFVEMIKLTEEGKLWRYPINNEQGLEEEEKVPFYDHVLLDHLLEPFPTQGPVRQFMELVLMGLSQNPHITVERKHQTIEYYRQYFEDRNLMINFETTDDEKVVASN